LDRVKTIYLFDHIGYNKDKRLYYGGRMRMNSAQKILFKLTEGITEKELAEVIDFIGYLKMKREKELYKELEQASESSLDFWNTEIDDEVWNDV
jgi:hypothetical protein